MTNAERAAAASEKASKATNARDRSMWSAVARMWQGFDKAAQAPSARAQQLQADYLERARRHRVTRIAAQTPALFVPDNGPGGYNSAPLFTTDEAVSLARAAKSVKLFAPIEF
jgi:hypothetical protein